MSRATPRPTRRARTASPPKLAQLDPGASPRFERMLRQAMPRIAAIFFSGALAPGDVVYASCDDGGTIRVSIETAVSLARGMAFFGYDVVARAILAAPPAGARHLVLLVDGEGITVVPLRRASCGMGGGGDA